MGVRKRLFVARSGEYKGYPAMLRALRYDEALEDVTRY
jgi:hypothetical protein